MMHNAVNTTAKQQTIGGKLLYPGESRPIEVHEINEALKKGMDVPGYEAPEAIETFQLQPTTQQLSTEVLIDMTVKKLENLLNELTDQQILDLESAEKFAEQPRKTLLDAIVKEMDERRPA